MQVFFHCNLILPKKNIECPIAYKASTSTAFATEAAGIVGRLVHISALCLLSFNAVTGKARASYRRITLIHHSGAFYGDVLHEGITTEMYSTSVYQLTLFNLQNTILLCNYQRTCLFMLSISRM